MLTGTAIKDIVFDLGAATRKPVVACKKLPADLYLYFFETLLSYVVMECAGAV